jgi:radical SAM protein with 4Fe4S-binding SPASM domain
MGRSAALVLLVKGRSPVHKTSGIGSKVRGALRLAGAGMGRAFVGPRMVGLEVTHYCNLGCGFCETHGRFMAVPIVKRRSYVGERRSMDLETIERLSRSMAKLGVEWVELSGKGDPIVHPQLADIVRIIKAAKLRCSMFTNGTVRRPDLVPTLVKSGLDRLNLSLNAASAPVFAKVTGKDLFPNAIEFIREVIAARRAQGGDRPWVRLTFVVCKDNVEEVEAQVDLCRELQVDEGGWCIMGELAETSSIQIDHADAQRLLAGIPEWSRRLEASGLAHDLANFAEDLRTRIGTGPVQDNPLQKELPCYEGWMHSVIGPDGAVAPCCYCDNVPLGNVVEKDFAEIWHGEQYQDFRRRSLEMPKTQRAICRECFTNCNRSHENKRTHDRLVTIGMAGRASSHEPAPDGLPAPGRA